MILRAWQLPMALVVTLATDGHTSRVREMEGWRFGSGAGAHMAGGGGSVEASLARVTGTVYDSLIGGPLAGADVQLLRRGTPALVYNARTDSAGRFALNEVDGGTYQAGFFHPRLDSMGIELPTRHVTLSAAGRSDIELATPSRLTVLASVCPDTTRADGRFAICNVPADVGVTLRAAAGPDSSGAVAVTFPPLGIVSRDVYVAPLVSDQERAVARLTGRVTGRTGTPIFGARVSLSGWESAASTDSGGHFTFPQVPGGSTTLDVRSVGFAPVRLSIDLRTGEGARNDLAITMSPSPTTLAPVTVVDRRSEVLIRSGFDTRRHGALGRFIDEEALRKSGAQSTTSYLSQFPGMMARSGGRGMRMFMRDPQGLVCAPTVWVDGAPYLPAAEAEGVVDIDLLADITNIAGIEIYRRVNQAPPQFAGTTRSACGVIVIWRKGS